MPIISVSDTFRIMRALLGIRAHSTWNTTWKVMDQNYTSSAITKRLYEPVVLYFGSCCLGDMLLKRILGKHMQRMFSQETGQPAPVRSASEAQGLKTCTLEHTTELESYSTWNKDPKGPKESNMLRLWVFLHILLAVKPQANYLAFLCPCVLVCRTEW